MLSMVMTSFLEVKVIVRSFEIREGWAGSLL